MGCDNDGMHLYCLAGKNKRKTACPEAANQIVAITNCDLWSLDTESQMFELKPLCSIINQQRATRTKALLPWRFSS